MTARRCRTTSSTGGFTLIELLIAVAILVFLTAILFGGLRLASYRLEQRSTGLERTSRVALMQNFLRVELGDARPLTQGDAVNGPVDFRGRSDSVAFIGIAPESAVAGGLQAFSISFARARGAGSGVLRLNARLIRGADNVAHAHETVLVDGLQSATFAYFGSVGRERVPSWHETWEGERYLPSLLRLSLTFVDGRTMPDLVIALRLSEQPDPRIPPSKSR